MCTFDAYFVYENVKDDMLKLMMSSEFMRYYSDCADDFNNNIDYWNDLWDTLHPGVQPGDSDELMRDYNQYIAKKYQRIADRYNRELVFIELWVDPETCELVGRRKFNKNATVRVRLNLAEY